MISLWSGVGSMTSMTSLQIRDGEVELGAGVGLRRVLVVDRRVGDRSPRASCTAGRPATAMSMMPSWSSPKTTRALQHRRRVVEVHDGLLGAADRVEGALDEVVAALGQHLDRHVVGDVAALDELAAEVEVGLARRREADLDLLVAHLHEQLEHAQLALGVHRVDEGLVAVAQVDRAPARGLLDALGRPGAVGRSTTICSWNGTYFWNGMPDVCWGWIIAVALSSAFRSVSGRTRRTPRRGGPGSGLVAAAKEEARRTHASTVCRRAGFRPPRRSQPGS